MPGLTLFPLVNVYFADGLENPVFSAVQQGTSTLHVTVLAMRFRQVLGQMVLFLALVEDFMGCSLGI